MKLTLLTLILTIATFPLAAQDARGILDKSAEAYNNGGGIKATFILNSTPPNSSDIYSYDGTAYLKGNKFRIEIPDAITWFDGRTQWVYLKDTEEVNVSTPGENELQSISPAYLFNVYKTGFKITYKGEKTAGGKTLIEIELLPEKQNSDLKKILVGIDKHTNMLSTITLIDKSGMTNSLLLKKISTGVELPDTNFKFNKNDYPGAEIIDLR